MVKVGGILEVHPPKIKWQPGEAGASELYHEWPLDPTLTRAVCLNFPSFPTISGYSALPSVHGASSE